MISGRTIGILAFALISNSDRFTKKKSTACNLKFVSNSVLFFDLGGLHMWHFRKNTNAKFKRIKGLAETKLFSDIRENDRRFGFRSNKQF